MRRYELMLVLRPDTPEERAQAIVERITRSVGESDGQVVKVSPWGRRRLAYPIGQYREGSYHIVVFEAASDFVAQLEHSLNITEEVMRHLVTRVERPATARRAETAEEDDLAPPAEEQPEERLIDESESEAAPAATD